MDLSLTAARLYGAARPVTAPDPSHSADSLGQTLGQAAEGFAQTLARAEAAATQSMMGEGDPHALVTALSEAQLAVETVVAVRDRVVEAYMEILRMPV